MTRCQLTIAILLPVAALLVAGCSSNEATLPLVTADADALADQTETGITDDSASGLPEVDAPDVPIDPDALAWGPNHAGNCEAEGLVPPLVALDLRFDLTLPQSEVWPTRQTLSFDAPEAGDAVRLFGQDFEVLGASVPYRYNSRVGVFCTGPFVKGQRVSVTIDFVSQPFPWRGVLDEPRGMRTWTDKATGVYAIGPATEPNGSSLWLFSPQARPSVDKANDEVPGIERVDLELQLPDATWRATGPSGSGVQDGTTWRFSQKTPMPLYALAFLAMPVAQVVASGTTAAGMPVTAVIPGTQPLSSDKTWVSVSVIDWMSAAMGPYAYEGNLTLVSVPGYESAMEHVGNLWFAPYHITDVHTLAHETVHQWWGNDVRIKEWRDIWMDEGIDTWFTDFAVAKGLSLETTPGSWAQADRVQGGQECAWGKQGPLRFSLDADFESMWMQRNIYYTYGAMVLHMVGRRLMDKWGLDLMTVMRKWYEAKRGTAVTTDDLRDFLAQETGDAVYWKVFFDQWVDASPCPTVTVGDYKWADGKVSFAIARDGKSLQPMPDFELVFKTPSGNVFQKVDLPPGQAIKVEFALPAEPEKIALDPNWTYTFAGKGWTGKPTLTISPP